MSRSEASETKAIDAPSIPEEFTELLAVMPPHVIRDDADYDAVIAFLDMLLARPKRSKGQAEFFETWAVLVAAYEADHHAIGDAGLFL
jgi:hypothetical protein